MKIQHLRLITSIILSISFIAGCTPVRETSRTDEHRVYLSDAEIRRQLAKILRHEPLEFSSPGIFIFSSETGDTLFAQNEKALLRPASNQKLITTVAALYTLGPDYNFRVTLYRTGELRNGKLSGDLIVKGYGNPLLHARDLYDCLPVLKDFGIKSIEGKILVDESFFDNEFWPPGWMLNFDPAYYAPYVSAVALNQNIVEVTPTRSTGGGEIFAFNIDPPTRFVGIKFDTLRGIDSIRSSLSFERIPGDSHNDFLVTGNIGPHQPTRTYYLSVKEPGLFAATVFAEHLTASGMLDSVRVGRTVLPDNAIPLVQFNTPIDTVLSYFNKRSDNLSGEMILKVISAELKGAPGSRAMSIPIVDSVLAVKDILVDPIRISDGSGLSYYNLVTPRTIGRLLSEVRNDPELFPIFYHSLTVMGVDGTLRNRMTGSDVRGRFRGKTGTLGGISSLSGYLTTYDDETLIVVILLQNFTGETARYWDVQHRIVELLYRYRSRPRISKY